MSGIIYQVNQLHTFEMISVEEACLLAKPICTGSGAQRQSRDPRYSTAASWRPERGCKVLNGWNILNY